MQKLGEFELLVLLSILRQEEDAYANRVREDLVENAGRSVTRGALYRTLDRLTEKGLLKWDLEPSEVPERGGHPMRRLTVTGERAHDMALRFRYAGIDVEKLHVEPDHTVALEAALAGVPPGGTLDVLPTYTAMHQIRAALVARGAVGDFWDASS